MLENKKYILLKVVVCQQRHDVRSVQHMLYIWESHMNIFPEDYKTTAFFVEASVNGEDLRGELSLEGLSGLVVGYIFGHDVYLRQRCVVAGLSEGGGKPRRIRTCDKRKYGL